MKKLLTVLLVLACMLSMSGCGEKEPEEKTVVTVWNYYSEHQLEYFQSVIAEFNASQDKYEVVYEGQTKGYLDNVATAVSSGTGPDFLIEYGNEATRWHEDDLVVDLSKYLDQDTIDNLIDSAYEYATNYDDGGMYCYPIIGTGDILWIVPEALEAAGVEVPETWDELFAAAKTIHEKVTYKDGQWVTDGSGTPVIGWTSSMADTLFMVGQQCGGTYDATTGELTINNEKVIEWLKKYQEGCEAGYLSSTFVNGYANTDQEAGIVAMGGSSVAGRPYYSTISPLAAHQPQMDMDDTANYASISRSRGIIVLDNGDEDKIKGAVEFLKFFTQAEYNEEFCEVMNYYAVLKNTLETEEYKAFVGETGDFEKVWAEYGSYYPNSNDSQYMKTALKSVMGEVATGKDPATAIEEALKTYETNRK